MSFTHRPLHPLGISPRFLLPGELSGFYFLSGSSVENKRLCLYCSEIETDFLVFQPALSYQYVCVFPERHTFLGAVMSVGCLFSLFETLYQLQSVFNIEYLYVWLSGK
jgi:hypothetical protein